MYYIFDEEVTYINPPQIVYTVVDLYNNSTVVHVTTSKDVAEMLEQSTLNDDWRNYLAIASFLDLPLATKGERDYVFWLDPHGHIFRTITYGLSAFVQPTSYLFVETHMYRPVPTLMVKCTAVDEPAALKIAKEVYQDLVGGWRMD